MSISTQLTRLARNVGALTADTNAIFEALRAKGVNVPANAQLSDVADMIESIDTKLKEFEFLTYFNNILDNVDAPIKGPSSTVISNTYNVQNRQFNIGNVPSISSNTARISYPVEFVDQDFTFDFFCSYVSSGSGYNITKCGIFGFLFAFYYPGGDRMLSYGSNTFSNFTSYNLNWTDRPGDYEIKNTQDWRSNPNNHIAFVYKSEGKELYVFYNGEKQFKLTGVNVVNSNIDIQFNVDTYAYTQVSLRKGDFSNSLDSFTVPDTPYADIIPKDSVLIGNRYYHYAKIGNYLWLTENLDYKFIYNGSTLPIGGTKLVTTPNAWYYNNDEAKYGIDNAYKCGLLYNWYAIKYLDDNRNTLLPDGWRVPTNSEWNKLIVDIGGLSNSSTVLKALDGSVASDWPSDWNGTDRFGFKALPAAHFWGSGSYIGDGSFDGLGTLCYFWTSSQYNETQARYTFLSSNETAIRSNYSYKTNGCSVRLIKDA